jgi:sulfide:quinone oxidoreductase
MKVDENLVKSGLTDNNGWIEVEESTLQHKRFNNIFAVGDAAGTSVLKTGAAIVDQVKTVVDAVRSIDEGKKPTVTYEGYGCDTILCTKKKSVLFEAYDQKKKPLALLEFFDPLKCHEIYWYFNSRMLKPYVMHAVMKGWA